ncbi:histidine protein methyltransferase 1 homolog [Saccoglossus kowalevskii]|uniref:protein-histidine N-methyltransferase n=1 Tax=Saccoglossus kowalevskii TaxID=10224 RepID=A0ABM0GYW6_SACKO|nr:PREDICTED: histidine protein methyltransferase 1 homolog [Saccoglossus kowalevskii]
MDFKFEFNVEQDDVGSTEIEDGKRGSKESNEELKECKKLKGTVHTAPVREFHPLSEDSTVLKERKWVNMDVGGVTLRHVDAADVEFKLQEEQEKEGSNLLKAISQHTDLIPQVYEGGLKIWECSVDLVDYLQDIEVDFASKRVLELGCGAGLPGLFAMQQGAVVCFQDYNEEVIQEITLPNFHLNINEKATDNQKKCTFLSGDWSSVEKMLLSNMPNDEDKFDVILTSETIYNVDSLDKLHQIIKSTLKIDGVVYLAAKTHYFGVGGGTRLFEELVQREGYFTITVCKTCSDGVQREILKMQRKK